MENTELDSNGLDKDGFWPMTKEAYKKIHRDFKGKSDDGIPQAMKLVNGCTSIVNVRIVK